MPATIEYHSPFDARFDGAHADFEDDDDPATVLLEYLSSPGDERMPPVRPRSGGLVSLIVDRGRPVHH